MYVVLLSLSLVPVLALVMELQVQLSLAVLPATRSPGRTAREAVSVAVVDVSAHVVAMSLAQPLALPWAFVLPLSVDMDV